jgi:hypothetical protein
MAVYAVFKLECLKIKHKANHFACEQNFSLKPISIAYAELQKMKIAYHQWSKYFAVNCISR